MDRDRRTKAALLLLRAGLGGFLLLWSLDKLFAPDATVGVYSHFYHLSIDFRLAYLFGVVEALLSLAIIVGVKKTATYTVGGILHGISTLSTLPQLLHPFGKNHLFIAGLPVLSAFFALFLMRDQDTLWTVDA